MYRILLADDEIIMLRSLEKIIETNFPNQFEIETAKTGLAAVNMADEFRPDMIFMDIHMPGMNGIDAIKEIKSKYSSVLFAVITAYDKFDYAREALNLQAFEFLMKPVSKNTVIDLLNRMMEKLDKEKKEMKNRLRIQEKLDTVVPILENGFINSVILDDISETEISYYREMLEMSCNYAFVMILQFGEENHNEVLTNPVGTGVRAQKYYSGIREKILEFFETAKVSTISTNRIIILSGCEEKELGYEERIAVIEQARKLRKSLQQVLDVKYRIGIGAPAPFTQMGKSFRQAVKALHEGKSRVVHYADIPDKTPVNQGELTELENVLLEDIAKGKAENLEDEIYHFIDKLNQLYSGKLDMVRLKILEVLIVSYRDLGEYVDEVVTDIAWENVLSELARCKTSAELMNWTSAGAMQLCSAVKENNKDENVVLKAKKYIHEHFNEDISLNEVAEEVEISPYYFSKLFKEEAGINFIDYLTDIRLEKAKELLRNPSISIKEICVSSGYSNPNYFSRIFKKSEGITPSEYRDRFCGQ